MATKTSTPVENTSDLKTFRDVDKLSKDAASETASPDPVESTQAMLIKQMADDLKLKQLESLNNRVEANLLESQKNKLEKAKDLEEIKSTPSPIKAPISSLLLPQAAASSSPGAMADVIRAALSEIKDDELKIQWLNENKHLLYGVPATPTSAMSFFNPPDTDKKKGTDEVGSLLSGLAQMQLAQGQELRNSLLTLVGLQKQLEPKTPSTPPQSSSDDMKLLVAAIAKLAESFAGGQSQMQQQLQALRDEAAKQQQSMWEKLIQAQTDVLKVQKESEQERYLTTIQSLQGQIKEMETKFQQSSQHNLELGRINQMLTDLRNAGINVTTQTPDQEKAQKEYELELRKLEMQERVMRQQQEAEMARAQAFHDKIQVAGSLFDAIKTGYDSQRMKDKLASVPKGSSAQRLSAGAAGTGA